MQTIIIAGGKGTRLKPLTDTIPKLLLTINKKPLIDHVISNLKYHGCTSIIICAGYLSDKIENHLKQNDYGIPIKISTEKEPLGTAGALYSIKDLLEEDFFILYGDIYTDVNFQKMFQFHKQKAGLLTAAIHPSDHPKDSDLVEFNSDFRITKIHKKPHASIPEKSYSLAAMYMANNNLIKYLDTTFPQDIAHDLLPKLLENNVPIFGYNTLELMLDIGTPERLVEAEKIIIK